MVLICSQVKEQVGMVMIFAEVPKLELAVVPDNADVPFARRGAYDVLVDKPDS